MGCSGEVERQLRIRAIYMRASSSSEWGVWAVNRLKVSICHSGVLACQLCFCTIKKSKLIDCACSWSPCECTLLVMACSEGMPSF